MYLQKIMSLEDYMMYMLLMFVYMFDNLHYILYMNLKDMMQQKIQGHIDHNLNLMNMLSNLGLIDCNFDRRYLMHLLCLMKNLGNINGRLCLRQVLLLNGLLQIQLCNLFSTFDLWLLLLFYLILLLFCFIN